MLKHVGKHNDKRCVIVFRKIPELEHMALVIYSDLLPRMTHDEVMRAVESPQGQEAQDISDVLFRTIMADGTNCLESLHRNGLMKKVPTNQVLVTPTTTSSVRLDELNDILDEMAKGKEAMERLQNLDTNRGYTGKKNNTNKNQPRRAEIQEVGERRTREAQGNTSAADMLSGMLSDADLAAQRLEQAQKMESTAKQLLEEATRLKAEADSLNNKADDVGTTKKTKAEKQEA
ncbi:hypothetical protein UFOVP257_395 [uncultured Caudovirales phage]|uniref:Uncharacterized protein n=1 Tax=uncultured Caudovirales phage TaxID=2100421 RepID=A0A6J5LK10_9CAUD|nr:hypothetical protein UFOVP257_395 [uncultured Caudovirales phage]